MEQSDESDTFSSASGAEDVPTRKNLWKMIWKGILFLTVIPYHIGLAIYKDGAALLLAAFRWFIQPFVNLIEWYNAFNRKEK